MLHARSVAALLVALLLPVPTGAAEPVHGIAMHGEPALPPDFDHLPYADPQAPKGGRIAYGFVGSFDSMNPFIVMGTITIEPALGTIVGLPRVAHLEGD